jgi:hypothetical protein
MNRGPDHLQAGRELLELQLAMMKGAMTLMADSAQRLVALSLGVASTAGAAARRQGTATAACASAAPRRQRQTPTPPRTPDRASSKDYALRMQEDADSILHAFAMVPDAADRLIRTSALLTEKPGHEVAGRDRRPAKAAPVRRAARRAAAEHAR